MTHHSIQFSHGKLTAQEFMGFILLELKKKNNFQDIFH